MDIGSLIELHRGLPRQGPGDEDFSRALLPLLPPLPVTPRIADLGCGSGAAALMLAEHFRVRVRALDSCRIFLDELEAAAAARRLGERIEAIEGDMGAIDWADGSLDLLWSEGAAYILGFAGALARWRPLLAPGGVAVISELSWFSDRRPEEAVEFWLANYPAMAAEQENAAIATRLGYEVLAIRRLPSEAWWRNYYGPLRQRIDALRAGADPAMQAVIRETEVETALFERHADSYGYTFYVLRNPPQAGTGD
jgi:SAM-dependent methyltransferase